MVKQLLLARRARVPYTFVDVVNPLGYAAKIAGTVVVSNVAAVVFYKLRNRGTQR